MYDQQGAAVGSMPLNVVLLSWSSASLPPKTISLSVNKNKSKLISFLSHYYALQPEYSLQTDIPSAVAQRRRGSATILTWDQQKRVRSIDLNRKMWLHRPQLGEPVWEKTGAPAA